MSARTKIETISIRRTYFICERCEKKEYGTEPYQVQTYENRNKRHLETLDICSACKSSYNRWRSISGRLGSDAQRVREWAAANGIHVNARGRVPAQIIEQYRKAQEEVSV